MKRNALLWVILCSILAGMAATAAARDPRAEVVTDSTVLRQAPCEITSGGHYTLMQNLEVTGATTAIVIKADNVVLDLGGWTISGDGSGSASSIGIRVTGANVTICNGAVRKFNYGISVSTPVGASTTNSAAKIQRMRVLDSGYAGVTFERADGCSIEDSEVLGVGSNNTGFGVSVSGNGCTVERNRIQVQGVGIDVSGGPIGTGGTGTIILSNAIQATTHGINFQGTGSGTYVSNIVVGATSPYTGGTNGGGNL
jgi:hypothetical protein